MPLLEPPVPPKTPTYNSSPNETKRESGWPSTKTEIGRAVLQNRTHIVLSAESLLLLIDERLASLVADRRNSAEAQDEITRYQELKQRLEAFRGAALAFSAGKVEEKAIVDTTNSLVRGINNWWTKSHAQICQKTFEMGLFLSAVVLCSLTGSGGALTVAVAGALVGGKPVIDAIKTLSPQPKSKQRRS